MIKTLSKNQNWAKLAPILGIITSILLIIFFKPSQALFWALINIPLYLFHQTEEHLWPGGFKKYLNRVVKKLPECKEALTDEKIFWINIIFVWLAFLIFGILSFFNIGFGLLIVIFSITNSLTHIVQGIKQKEWNPGLVTASLQFVISVYAAYFITFNGLTNQLLFWLGSIIFSAIVHIALFKMIIITK